MKKIKNYFLVIVIFTVLIATSGCTSSKTATTDTSAVDGGIFVTVNKGVKWKQMNAIPTVSGKPSTLSGTSISLMRMDPSDNNTIYYAPIGKGLFYTYNAGSTWQRAEGIPQATVRSISVDPNNKCTIYASLGNKVYKTEDCSRTWSKVYFDNDVQATVDAVTVNPYNSEEVYIGLSRGDLVKSLDAGASWQTITRSKSKIKDIIFDPNNEQFVYLVTADKGLFRSSDSGNNWAAWNKALNSNKLDLVIKDLLFFKGNPGVIYIAVPQGMLKTADNGETWEKVDFIPPGNKVNLNSLAVNPDNLDEMYYVTNRTFYSSVDGGVNWTPIQLTTTRAGWKLLIDPTDPRIIYMGVKYIEPK